MKDNFCLLFRLENEAASFPPLKKHLVSSLSKIRKRAVATDWGDPSPLKAVVIVWLWLATKGPHGCLYPAGVWRRMERNRQKLVGRDKGSLTEQQTKGTGTTTIQIRRKHKTK